MYGPQCYVAAGCKTRTINEQDKIELEDMEVWTWRRLLKVVAGDLMKNDIDILNRVEENGVLLNIIKERRI